MTLGENIKRIRQEKNLTQKQLGDLCKPPMADSAIRRYESDKVNPKIETLRKIATALDVYTYDLLYDEKTATEKKTQEIAEVSMQFINNGHLDMPDNDDITDEILLRNFNKLNNSGKKEAYKRVGELTEIPRYTQKET